MNTLISSDTRLTPEDYLANVDCLPTAPRVLPQLLSVLTDPDCETTQVVELISFDPSLTAKVLRTCNSAAFGLACPVTDIDAAVNRLGLKMIYQLVAAAAGSRALQPASSAASQPPRLWEQSVTTALAAQLLAKDLKLNEGVQFTAGLLHDIGKVVLAATWKDKYAALLDTTQTSPVDLVLREQESFHIDHAELGGRLLAHWKFPSTISACVWHHPSPVAGMPYERETACLTLAEFVAENVLSPDAIAPGLSAGQERAVQVFGFAPERLKAYIELTKENFQFVNALCALR